MILNKDNKNGLTVGDTLEDTYSKYMITSVYKNEKMGYINLTIEDIKTHQKIYFEPISKCYGMEWKKSGK